MTAKIKIAIEVVSLVLILSLAFTMAVFFIDAMSSWKNNSNIYPATMIVDTIDRHNDVVVVRDGIGNLWEFDGVEDWEVGDVCAVIMNDNATPNNIYDDVIEQVRYCGVLEWFEG